jgi:hypothetical protein
MTSRNDVAELLPCPVRRAVGFACKAGVAKSIYALNVSRPNFARKHPSSSEAPLNSTDASCQVTSRHVGEPELSFL